MRVRASLKIVALSLAVAACSGRASTADTTAAATTDPNQMPQDIVAFEDAGGWGNHHLEWHTERQWDLLNASDLAWAKKQGWKRADIQEGAAGNGFEFLIMHRAMLTILRGKFPQEVRYFTGWATPPTDPKSKSFPLPGGAKTPFDKNMLAAIAKLQNHLDQFASEDDFGLYLETSLRPVAGKPDAQSSDPTTGIHNYIHNRFSDSNSPIDMGDPSKNLANKVFWDLHGWIDARWTAYRAQHNLSDDDPTFQAALKNAIDMFSSNMKLGGSEGGDGPPPDSLTKFFEQENNWGGDSSGGATPSPSGGGDDGGTGDDASSGDDASASTGDDASSGDPCNGVADGSYCGGDGVSGDASTVYQCTGGALAWSTACTNGCQANGDGTDYCN